LNKLVTALIAAAVIVTPLSGRTQEDCAESVLTSEGPVKGVQSRNFAACEYKGVPYAAPPVGDRRFRAPSPPAMREAPLVADSYGPACMQDEGVFSIGEAGKTQEDCLYLNVWRPMKAGWFPVMFWIHGGEHVRGTGNARLYDGSRLASEKDVVVVAINYRLGPFGFLALPELAEEDPNGSTGNYGLMDCVSALRWVNNNIESFGGDPYNITIFGQSAGGALVCDMLASEQAGGLFHHAIIQSGACDLVAPIERGQKGSRSLAEKMDCDGPDIVQCMRDLGPDRLLNFKSTDFRAMAHVDGHMLKDVPLELIKQGKFNKVPVIVGSNRDEANIYHNAPIGVDLITTWQIKYELGKMFGKERVPKIMDIYHFSDYRSPIFLLSAVHTDVYTSRAYMAAEALSPHVPVYMYQFDWADEFRGSYLGAFHGLELPFVFGNFDVEYPLANLVLNPRVVKRARPLSDTIMNYWARFALEGTPNQDRLPEWSPYDPDDKLRMYLDYTFIMAPLSEGQLKGYRYMGGILLHEIDR